MIDLKTTSILADESGVIWFITDIKAPAYWWNAFEHKILKQLSEYKFTVSNELIMKTIEEREFVLADFSFEALGATAISNLSATINDLNNQRLLYLKLQNPEYKKKYWYAMMQSLPYSYNSSGSFRYSLTSAFIMVKALKPKLLKNEYEYKEFIDFFKYLEDLIKGFSL